MWKLWKYFEFKIAGKAGFGLLANILIQKYDDHLPLYRQSEILERSGIEISRSTMTGWVAYGYSLLSTIAEKIKKYIFTCSEIHGDDTPIKTLMPGLGKTKIGRIYSSRISLRFFLMWNLLGISCRKHC